MNAFNQSELETVKRDAQSSEGKTPEERIATFIELLKTVEEIQAHLSPQERARRSQIARRLQPFPDPWWRNFRKQALDEFRCQISSS